LTPPFDLTAEAIAGNCPPKSSLWRGVDGEVVTVLDFGVLEPSYRPCVVFRVARDIRFATRVLPVTEFHRDFRPIEPGGPR
jgi:hypothetical protein